MTTATDTKTIYLTRLQKYFKGNGFDKSGESLLTYWVRNKRLPNVVEMTLQEISYHEETYKGFQLVIVGWHRELRDVFDANGNHITTQNTSPEVASKGEPKDWAEYWAYAWHIDEHTNHQPDLPYASYGAVVKGVFGSSEFNTTLKKTKKRLDSLDKIYSVRQRLIEISTIQFKKGSTDIREFIPYNAHIGDEVFIQAHGRLRKGIIVETTGSRFVVGYVTPSNHRELKYKTLALPDIYVQGIK
jgi:hypothetical protein